MLHGEGTIQLQLGAAVPQQAAGTHHLRYRNVHRPDIGVYLANALVPTSQRVAVVAQRRDVDQRELVIEYLLRDDAATGVRGWLPTAAAGAIAMTAAVL